MSTESPPLSPTGRSSSPQLYRYASQENDYFQSARGVPEYDVKDAEFLHDEDNHPHESNPAEEIAARVDSAGTKAIYLLSGVLIAATAAFIASYGIVATAAVLGAGYLVSQLVVAQANNTLADMNSPLSTEAKVELFARAKLWEETILTATLLGVGGGLIYQGISSILQGAALSVLKGTAFAAVGGYGGLMGLDRLQKFDMAQDEYDLRDLIAFHDRVQKQVAYKEVAALLFELRRDYNSTSEEIADKMRHFLAANPYTLLDLAQLLPLLGLFKYEPSLSLLLDENPQITGEEMLERLPKNALTAYLMPRFLLWTVSLLQTFQQTLQQMSSLSNDEERQLRTLRSTLQLYTQRLERFPADADLANVPRFLPLSSFTNADSRIVAAERLDDGPEESAYSINCAVLKQARIQLKTVSEALEAFDKAAASLTQS